ncbi:hypothetical protein [Sulfurisphaera tokodaii]|nr:hypothetical protein [Sulfurisphaera tokodaii]
MLEEIDFFILIILSEAKGRTIEEISDETGIREEIVYHILELLRYFDLVKKSNDDRYYSEYTELAKLLLDLKMKNLPDEIIN